MINKIAPKTFLRSGEGALANYNYTDIASGLGINIFYASHHQDQLSGASLVSGGLLLTEAIGSYGFDGKFSASWTDFDATPFNLPRTVKGTAYVEGYADRDANDINIQCIFQKVSGSTVTDISDYYSGPNATVDSSFLLAIPLKTTHFKKGDYIRFKARKSGTGGCIVVDPSHTYYATETTLKCYIPFQLDL